MDPATLTPDTLSVHHTEVPPELSVGAEIGKGANNKVYRVDFHGHACVLRAPRRRSDTQQRGSAVWEMRHTLKAAQIGVGPAVYAAWCARHAQGKWPAGLYVVTERFTHDLEVLLCEEAPRATANCAAIGESISTCLQSLAEARILVYDLKPSNMVVRFSGGVAAPRAPRAPRLLGARGSAGRGARAPASEVPEVPEVKVIDFGRDFCEWGQATAGTDASTPVIDMLRRHIESRSLPPSETQALLTHILFAVMVVQLSATTTRQLHEDRSEHRMDADARAAVNPVAPIAAKLLDSMQGCNKKLLREVLRHDDVRGVLRHYHGRRDAGTRRTLRLARGKE